MDDLTSRLVLGTVQLGLQYGRMRNAALMAEGDAFGILDAAWAVGVRAFDTAEAYGQSAARLRHWIELRGIAESVDVITKCPIADGETVEQLRDKASKALQRFEGIASVMLLSHGAVSGDLWPVILETASDHGAGAGQSVYSAAEVRAACMLPDTARVQAPGNALDHRAIDARGNSSVALDIRSVYLQGVLLETPERAEQRAPGSGEVVKTLRSSAAAMECPLGPLLVASVLHATEARDRLVIGVDHPGELEAIDAAFQISPKTVSEFRQLIRNQSSESSYASFLDPRRWPAPPAQ